MAQQRDAKGRFIAAGGDGAGSAGGTARTAGNAGLSETGQPGTGQSGTGQSGTGQPGPGQSGKGKSASGKPQSGKAGTSKRRARRRPLILTGAGERAEGLIRLEQARRTSFTAKRKARFLAVLSETSNVSAAAAAAGIATITAYTHRRRDAAFARGWEKALADAIADLKMLVAHQGRFGAIDEMSSCTDADGVRHVRRTRQVADSALRTLVQASGRAALSDAEDRAEAEALEREIQIDAAERIMLRRIREMADDPADGE